MTTSELIYLILANLNNTLNFTFRSVNMNNDNVHTFENLLQRHRPQDDMPESTLDRLERLLKLIPLENRPAFERYLLEERGLTSFMLSWELEAKRFFVFDISESFMKNATPQLYEVAKKHPVRALTLRYV